MDRANKDRFQYALAAGVIIGWFLLVGIVLTRPLPSADQTFTNLLFSSIMAISNAGMLVLGYFFGSSKGSSEKNEMLADKKPEA